MLADFFSILLEYHQVVTMDDFFVFLRPELLLDLGGFKPFDLEDHIGREVHQPLREFFAVLVETADGIARFEWSAGFDDAGSQEALASPGQRLNGSWVERQGPSRSERKGDPMFAAGEATLFRKEEATARAAGQYVREEASFLPIQD